MAYQSLNIIGSFTAGTPAVQREITADRDRAEAYRSLLRNQGRYRDGVIVDVESDQRMVVGDAPHERRNPYLFLRYDNAEKKPEAPESQELTNGASGEHLDKVV